jgi:DNA-directed RNA polymerase II subunit RPB2
MARNLFSCGQSKQACSVYNTNYPMRMDKTSMVLNYGQAPLLKSRYGKYINNDENSYGENAIVAIMCYTGYNVEDAILINEGALNRRLFRTSYFTTYETREENTMNATDAWVDKKIGNVDDLKIVQCKKVGYTYHKLDPNGMIREGEVVDDKTVLIGFTSNSDVDVERRIDQSIVPKKRQLGTVDKTYITEGEEGERIGKVRIVDQRIPTLGDKFASRVGQKGTIGMVIKEVDMNFTSSGLRPDIIINPHAQVERP